MTDPPQELARQIELCFSQLAPERVFRTCRTTEDEVGMIVRIYSHGRGFEGLIPTPYQHYRFDKRTGGLTPMSAEESARYRIPNYK